MLECKGKTQNIQRLNKPLNNH